LKTRRAISYHAASQRCTHAILLRNIKLVQSCMPSKKGIYSE
jgi:hypothetical protein